jgi:photosystem II stability/assembly factor-like uncharacterized protein
MERETAQDKISKQCLSTPVIGGRSDGGLMKARPVFLILCLLFTAGCTAQAQAVPGQVAAVSILATPLPDASPTPVSPTLQWLQMIDAKTGWAITAERMRLVHTLDGGLTWKDVTPQVEAVRSTTSFFLDGSTAFVEGYAEDQSSPTGQLFITGDGGATWSGVGLPFAGGALQFQDATHGWAVVAPPGSWSGPATPALVYQTSDGGKTWTQMMLVDPQGALPPAFPPGSVQTLNGATIEVHSPTSMWLGGGKLNSSQSIPLWESTDGGATWQQKTLPLPAGSETPATQLTVGLPVFVSERQPLFSVAFALTAEGGGNPRSVMALYTSEDGGDTWSVQPALVNGFLPTDQINFISPNVGFVHCSTAICETRNRGQTWKAIPSNVRFSADQNRALMQVQFITGAIGWALTTGGLYHTVDGGTTWKLMNLTFR